MTRAATRARRSGVMDASMSVAIAASTDTAPIRTLRSLEFNVVSSHRRPKVPRNLPTVVQVTPERSSASHSRQATYTLSGIISTSRLTGTRSGASGATIGATMFRLAFLKW
jgi:hypothetical protein